MCGGPTTKKEPKDFYSCGSSSPDSWGNDNWQKAAPAVAADQAPPDSWGNDNRENHALLFLQISRPEIPGAATSVC